MSVAEYEVKLTGFSRVAPHIVSHEPDSASIFVVANPVPKFLSSPSNDLGRLRLRRESFFLFPFDQNFPASLSGTAFTFELDLFALLDSSCKADKVGGHTSLHMFRWDHAWSSFIHDEKGAHWVVGPHTDIGLALS